jgi:pimeloyl-ACP methyl ester carboxylesterase
LDVEPECFLHVPHLDSRLEMDSDFVKSLNANGDCYLTDLRGLGENTFDPAETRSVQLYGMDYMMHSFAIMFGDSLLGGRVQDLLRTMDLLAANGARRLHVSGKGQGTIIAAMAAIFRDDVASLTLMDAPASFHEWAASPVHDWPASATPRGVLKAFDLPELYHILSQRVTLKICN